MLSLYKISLLSLFVVSLNYISLADTSPDANVKQFFISPNQSETLRLALPSSTEEKINFIITNYQGEQVSSGISPKKGDSLEIPINLPSGFYEVALPDLKQYYGVDVIPVYQGEVDPFFCMDSALSWLTPIPVRESLIQVLKRQGIAMSRERLTWPMLHPKQGGAWDWETSRAFEKTRQLYQANNVPILELAHSAPSWAIRNGSGKLPDSINESAKDWRIIGKQWDKVWGGIDAWNEPDLLNAPADQYVAWAHTLRYALRAEGVNTPIGGGVIAYMSPPYMDHAAKCGLIEASDFVSFHYYGEPESLIARVSELRLWLKTFGHENLPLWLTECGAPWMGTPNSQPSVKDTQIAAIKIAGNAIEAKALGVERFFTFVYVNYSEHGSKNFGILDKNGSPTRAMAAYSTALLILAHKSYVGDIPVPQLKTKSARVFASQKGEAVIVLYSGDVNKSASVSLDVVPQQILGADGRPLKAGANGGIPIPDGLGYVTCSLESIRTKLQTDTPAARLSQKKDGNSMSPLFPVILKAQLAASPVDPEIRGYRIKEGVTKFPIPILVANLGTKNLKLNLEFYDGSANSSTPLAAVTANLTPQSETELSAEIDLSSLRSNLGDMKTLRVEAKSSGERVAFPTELRFLFAQGLEAYLKEYSYRYALPMGETHRWTTNITPTGTMKFENSSDAQWGFTATFTGGDRWVYPQFLIPQEANPDKIQGILVRARLTQPGTVRILTWNADDKPSTLPFPLIPADGVWHVAYVPLSSFVQPDASAPNQPLARQLKKISIGCNSKENENHLDVSDFYLLGN